MNIDEDFRQKILVNLSKDSDTKLKGLNRKKRNASQLRLYNTKDIYTEIGCDCILFLFCKGENMARRMLFNMSDCILKTTIKIGAREGMESVTARKIADVCDVTDATVFVYFKNKQNLLLQAYRYVFDWTNNIIEKFIENPLRDNTLTDEKWNVFFGKLVENVDNAKYFCNYRYSGRCVSDVKPTKKQIDICKNIITKKSLKNTLSDNDYAVIWGNIMESVAYYVIQVADGRLANSIQKYELIRELLFNGYRQ